MLFVHFFLFSGLASNNAIYLILIIIRKSSSDLFHIDKKFNYPKPITTPLSHMVYNTSIYLTILLAFERYLCVCWPKKAKYICTPKKTKIYILICALIGLIYTIPRFFQFKYEFNEKKEHYEVMKTIFEESYGYRKGYLTWSDFVYRLILPTICLAYFNIAVFREVKFSFSEKATKICSYLKQLIFLFRLNKSKKMEPAKQ